MEVSQLFSFPIKSCGAISHNSFALNRFGPADDRRWMLVDPEDGSFISQRKYPMLCLVKVQTAAQGYCLSAPNMPSINLSAPAIDSTRLQVTVWGDSVTALDMGNDCAAWFSDYLSVPCRLVYMGDSARRDVDTDYANSNETVGFADGFPLLLISQASLDDLNHRLDVPASMLRFRPNIVISGSHAFEEDSWKRIRIGSIEFDVAKPCARCVMPSIDPLTGEKTAGFNRVLASFRRRDGEIFFGQNLLYQHFGSISLGDPITVIE